GKDVCDVREHTIRVERLLNALMRYSTTDAHEEQAIHDLRSSIFPARHHREARGDDFSPFSRTRQTTLNKSITENLTINLLQANSPFLSGLEAMSTDKTAAENLLPGGYSGNPPIAPPPQPCRRSVAKWFARKGEPHDGTVVRG